MRKKKPKQIVPTDVLSGENPRHEVAGCPTALDPKQAEAPQQDGGGGAPGTGDDPTVPSEEDKRKAN